MPYAFKNPFEVYMFLKIFKHNLEVPSLKLTAKAYENHPFPWVSYHQNEVVFPWRTVSLQEGKASETQGG